MFRPTFLLAALVAFAIAMVTMILNAATIFESQYLWKSIQSVRILIPIALALGVVKILHELGHAFACRSINRDCTEMGVMLLAFIPCLYCNVSDVWMESNRWKRMLVSAAGIYVEMLIAAICVPLWMYSNSGELKLFWFTLMTICSVNTLLINGNPLLRYDGYYLLSDAVGVPNLYAKAQNALSDRVASFFLRDSQSRPFSWLEIYGFSALLYRYFIVGAIVFTIYLFFVRMELATFGLLVALAIGTLTLTGTAIGTTRRLLRLRNQRNLRRGRIAWVLLTLMAILISGMFVPISSKIYADGEVVFAGNKMVFAPDYGKIRWLVGNGQKVQVGSNIAVIQNLDLELKIREQDAYVQQLEKTQEHLSLLQAQGADNSREIELHKQSLENAKKIAAEFEVQLDQLSLKSKAQGSLVALPASMNKRKATLDLTRSDSTLNPVNRNSFVEAGEPVAVVSSGSDQIVRLRIPERAADRVTAGQSVDLLINQYSPEILDGIVADIAIDTPTNLDAMEEIDDQKWIVVTVKLAQPSDEIFLNSKVKAVIHAGDESVYQCIKRILTDNFSY